MEQYNEKVMDHFYNPRNVGEIKDADGIGQVGNMKCGDIMYVYIKVGKREKTNEEYVKDIKFKTLGCAAAISASSMMTELAKGKSLDDAAKMTRDDINEALGILPAQKYHCSILSADAIHKAVEDYRKKSSKGV
jgi:nitrogen fixation NifU-like protein